MEEWRPGLLESHPQNLPPPASVHRNSSDTIGLSMLRNTLKTGHLANQPQWLGGVSGHVSAAHAASLKERSADDR